MSESPVDESYFAPLLADDVDRTAYTEFRESCLRIGYLPTFRYQIVLNVAIVAENLEVAVSAIRQLTHQEVRAFRICREDFDRAVAWLEAGTSTEALPSLAPLQPRRPASWNFHARSARQVASDLVEFAFSAGASDILLDDQEAWMEVSIKLAGQKEILPPVEQAFAPFLMKAFKETAGISTHSSAQWQSGFASFPVARGRRADLRVEVTPSVHGESLVARIQDRQLQLERMRRLPFRDKGQEAVARACLRQHQGLLIATGPTGHGKTTTLYSCLGQLDRAGLNIRTLEDPVEFSVPWITQIPVGSGTGRSFGEGLKSLLRQAPHVVLMGEIRDHPVAQTCIEAVDTGHLILATLHTRDALGAVSRLLDLGLTGRQIANALTLVIGQRLLRRLCPRCRRPVATTRAQASHFAQYGLPVPEFLHEPTGCPSCGERGEAGLVSVFEFFHPAGHEDLQATIGKSTSESYDEPCLRREWLKRGGSPLIREALQLAAQGEVTHAEVLKYESRPPPC